MTRTRFTAPMMPAAILLLGVMISACQPTDSEILGSSDTQSFCQAKSTPFAYSVCAIEAQSLADGDYALQLFWQDANKEPLLTFDGLLNHLPTAQTLAFAMNAGMYNEHYAPIGYTVIAGDEIKSLNLKQGGGNFHLLPNGVLWWDQSGKVQITESQTLSEQINKGTADPYFATQSGPMLVIDGQIHPKFNPDSTSLKIRNGAGVCTDGRIQFVSSEVPVTFYDFAALFKDDLSCPNALFLDGGIASALYAPDIDKYDKKEMGVMIGVVKTQ